MPEHEALARVASIETGSGHFLAREILRRTRELSLRLEEATCLEYFEGLGARGCIRGAATAVGNRTFMKREGLSCAPDTDDAARKLENAGNTVLFFGWEGEVQGYLAFGDRIKTGAAESLNRMQQRGLTVHLVSGDSQETTQAVAQRLGVEHFKGQSLPGDKVEIVRKLQQQGHRVGMMGDGVNDAAALAQADVGIALGTGSNILQEASDITLMTGHPEKLLEVLDLSHMTVRIIHQNLFFAFFYNILGIPLAVAGMLNPILAVVAMFASSLTVIGNTLRISRKHHGRRTV
jgi:Cu+-exporting ATPase